MKKAFLSAFLCAMLVLVMAPLSVFAAEDDQVNPIIIGDMPEFSVNCIKNLNGKPCTKAGQFEFEMYDRDGHLVATATNDATGHFVMKYKFTRLPENGDYYFSIVEKAGNDPKITYSKQLYWIKATYHGIFFGAAPAEPEEPYVGLTVEYAVPDDTPPQDLIYKSTEDTNLPFDNFTKAEPPAKKEPPKKAATPPTSDNNGTALWLTLGVMAGAALAGRKKFGLGK